MVLEKNYRNSAKRWNAFLIAIMLILALSNVSCASKKTTLQPTVIQNNIDNSHTARIDSIYVYVRDSIFVKKGIDTVYFERYKTLWRDRWHSDTLIRIDSMIIDKSRTEIVEVNRLHWWQTTLMWMGVIAITFIVIRLIIKR